MASFDFRLVDAERAFELVCEFQRGQRACYARYGAEVVTASDGSIDRALYLVVHRDGRMVAGIRIHRRERERRLPLERPLSSHPLVRRELAWRESAGLAELAGLWSAPDIAKTGIGGAVVGAAVAIAPALGLRHLCSFAHQFNRFTRLVGFEPDASIGEHPYPDDRYRSTVNFCDAVTLATADARVAEWVRGRRADVERRALEGTHPLDFAAFDASFRSALSAPVSRPKDVLSRRSVSMSTREDRSRPFTTLQRAEIRTPLATNLEAVETAAMPDDVAALLAAWPSITGAVAAPTEGARFIAVRDAEGGLLATATVAPAVSSELASTFSEATLARTRVLGNLAWSEGAARYAPLALYLAARRARVEGATTIAGYFRDASHALERTLDLRSLGIELAPNGAEACGQRIDIAAQRAYDAVLDTLGRGLDPRVFCDEVVETFERWLADLYGRGFFKAVTEGTLNRAQYVHAIANMHQFVRWTTRLLGHAVANSHDKEVRDHFIGHLQGEINHEVIIERDLAHLGEDVDFVVHTMSPSTGTRQFMSVQDAMIGLHHDPISFLASPLVAEGVAAHLTPAFLDALEGSIARFCPQEPKKAMVFFKSHVHTDGGDDGHWEMVLRILRKKLTSESSLRSFLSVMHASMRALTAAYDEYVEGLEIFARSRSAPITEQDLSVAAE